MTDTKEQPVDLLARAVEQMSTVLAGVRADQTDLPTPCRSWDVGALRDHIVHVVGQFTVAAQGGTPDWTAPPEPAGPDWLDVYRRRAGELLDAWRAAGDLSGTVEVPGMGEMPARFRVDMQTGELTAHAWDLATATGQDAKLDEELAALMLEWARQTIRDEFRGDEADGKVFGPQVPVPDGAPVQDRLAAFLGRDPAWTP